MRFAGTARSAASPRSASAAAKAPRSRSSSAEARLTERLLDLGREVDPRHLVAAAEVAGVPRHPLGGGLRVPRGDGRDDLALRRLDARARLGHAIDDHGKA